MIVQFRKRLLQKEFYPREIGLVFQLFVAKVVEGFYLPEMDGSKNSYEPLFCEFSHRTTASKYLIVGLVKRGETLI